MHEIRPGVYAREIPIHERKATADAVNLITKSEFCSEALKEFLTAKILPMLKEL